MDNSLSLARYFARLVWLLVHEDQSVDDQKGALRAVITVSKDASVRLGNKEGRLAVNGLVMPQALTGVQELAERLVAHGIEEIEIDQGAVAGEVLSLARLLAGEASTGDPGAFSARLAQVAGSTVRVRSSAGPAVTGAPASEAPAPADASVDEFEGRVPPLLLKLDEHVDPAAAPKILDDIAVLAEQATREGRTLDVAAIFSALLDREPAMIDPDVRQVFHATVRRLTKPTILRPIAVLILTHPASALRTERIMQRVGQDGVDAVVDQYNSARSVMERSVYHRVLSRLPHAREALVQMLQDSRWYVVRQAAEFLGEMGGEDAERPLAELLRHADERVRRAATRALVRIESAFTLDAIARAITDSSSLVRLEGVAGLAARKVGRAGSILAKAIDSEADPEVQYAILGALGRVASTESVQKLSRAAEAASGLFASRKNVGLRVAAVHALGEAHTPAALAALQTLASDKDRDVKEAVAKTLLLLRGTAA